jgi:FkbM family methyltransferase
MKGAGKGLKFSGIGNIKNYLDGTYEIPVQKLLVDKLMAGDVFYDIGANFGFFTILASKLVKTAGQVYAIEPVPDNARIIRMNTKANRLKNVLVIEKAISENEGYRKLLITQHHGGSTLSDTGIVPADMIKEMNVDVTTIDFLVTKGGLSPPTVIKLDVEGAELKAFSGMQKTIDKFYPTLIYEIDDGDKDVFQEKIYETQSFLKKKDYSIEMITNAYPKNEWNIAHFIANSNRS